MSERPKVTVIEYSYTQMLSAEEYAYNKAFNDMIDRYIEHLMARSDEATLGAD